MSNVTGLDTREVPISLKKKSRFVLEMVRNNSPLWNYTHRRGSLEAFSPEELVFMWMVSPLQWRKSLYTHKTSINTQFIRWKCNKLEMEDFTCYSDCHQVWKQKTPKVFSVMRVSSRLCWNTSNVFLKQVLYFWYIQEEVPFYHPFTSYLIPCGTFNLISAFVTHVNITFLSFLLALYLLS